MYLLSCWHEMYCFKNGLQGNVNILEKELAGVLSQWKNILACTGPGFDAQH